MKKILLLAVLAVLGFSVASCVEEEVIRPEITLAKTSVSIASEGGMVQVVCQVSNAVKGNSVSVSEDADWLEVDASKARIIEITATKNESGNERSADIIVSYPDADDVILTVTQTVWDAPITLTITGVESTAVVFSVKTAADDFTWVGQVVSKEWFDSMESDDAIFQEDMAYYSYEAKNADISITEYLKTILNKGSYEGLQYKGLDPSSDYVIYVYGMSPDGERLTEICSEEFRTDDPYSGPITFDIKITEADHIMDITITPSHDGVAYYWNIMDEETFMEWGGDESSFAQKFIDFEVADYLEYGDITSPSEYYEWYSTIGVENSQFECLASKKYIIFAAKWDEECKISGDVACVWYVSEGVTASDNVITLTLSNPSQSSFDVTTKTTNNDPYVVFSEPSSVCGWKSMTDEEIFDYIMKNYGTWFITDYICVGDLTEARFYDLKVDTEYSVVAFGYEAGVRTTKVHRAEISTLSAGTPSDCEFNFEVSQIEATSARVSVQPSDDAYYYYWMVFDADATADDVKAYMMEVLDDLYWGDWEEFRYGELSRGNSGGKISYLAPETDYKVAAVIVDEKTGEYLTDVNFSDTFKTKKMTYANVEIFAEIGKYYDGDELAAAVEDQYDQYIGYAYLPVKMHFEGDYAEYYYTIFQYEEGLEKPAVYPDSYLYSSLINYGVYYSDQVNFRAEWDVPMLLAAVAIDHNGNYSRVFRRKFTLDRSKASPIEDLLGVSAKSLSKDGNIHPIQQSSLTIQRNQVMKKNLRANALLHK